MAKAIWQGEVIAESKKIKKIEGYIFFPPDSVKKEFLKKSYTRHINSQFGMANFYNIRVGDNINWNGAWYYPKVKDKAQNIAGYIAFSPGIAIK
jgi:uncharacterized protein (DUF427 family)